MQILRVILLELQGWECYDLGNGHKTEGKRRREGCISKGKDKEGFLPKGISYTLEMHIRLLFYSTIYNSKLYFPATLYNLTNSFPLNYSIYGYNKNTELN